MEDTAVTSQLYCFIDFNHSRCWQWLSACFIFQKLITAGDATEKDCPDKTTLESVSLLKAAASPDLYGKTGENSVELTNGDSTATSNNESDVPQACVKDDGQPEVDNDQGDSENDSDSEKKATGTHKTSKNDTKSASQRKREAKKERKSRREAEKKQQALRYKL